MTAYGCQEFVFVDGGGLQAIHDLVGILFDLGVDQLVFCILGC